MLLQWLCSVPTVLPPNDVIVHGPPRHLSNGYGVKSNGYGVKSNGYGGERNGYGVISKADAISAVLPYVKLCYVSLCYAVLRCTIPFCVALRIVVL